MSGFLSSVAKSRSISLPLDLEAQIGSMLSTSALNTLSRNNPSYRSATRSSRPAASTNPWDYKNIIEKLQVAPVQRRRQSRPGSLSSVIKGISRQLVVTSYDPELSNQSTDFQSSVCRSLGWFARSRQLTADLRAAPVAIQTLFFDLLTLLQDVINTLEERLKPLVNAELSVLVDVLHQPELLFLEGTDARQRCESGGFISK